MDDPRQDRVADWRDVPGDRADWWHWRDALHGSRPHRAECGRGRTVAVAGLSPVIGLGGPRTHIDILTDRGRTLAVLWSEPAEWSAVCGTPPTPAACPDPTGIGPGIGWATHDMLGGDTLTAGCGRSVAEMVIHTGAAVGVLALVAQPGTATADDLGDIRALAAAGVVVVGDWCWRAVLGRDVAMIHAAGVGCDGRHLHLSHRHGTPAGGGQCAALVPVADDADADRDAVLIVAALAAEWVRRHAAADLPRRTRPAWVADTMRHSDRRETLARYGYDVPDYLPPFPCLERPEFRPARPAPPAVAGERGVRDGRHATAAATPAPVPDPWHHGRPFPPDRRAM